MWSKILNAHTRRDFLRHTLVTGAAIGLGTGLADLTRAAEVVPEKDLETAFRGGRRVGILPFQRESDLPMGVTVGQGLDARRYLDLARLEPDRLVTPASEFYVRTGVPDQLTSTRNWRLRLDGEVAVPVTLPIADLAPSMRDFGVHLLECAGNANQVKFGLISTARWGGVPVAAVLDRVQPKAGALIRISGFDGHSRPSSNSASGCSWIFTRDQLENAGAFFATHLDGQPLSLVNGFPIRLMIPGWYGCCAIKWVDRVEWVLPTAESTSQMREFAGRTHQDGVPAKAVAFQAATVDPAALPVRVEAWQVGDRRRYRIVGVLWGGSTGKSQLEIRFRPNDPWTRVGTQPERSDVRTWTLWSHAWDATPGRYLIQLRLDDPSIQTRRLDMGLYLRGVEIPPVG